MKKQNWWGWGVGGLQEKEKLWGQSLSLSFSLSSSGLPSVPAWHWCLQPCGMGSSQQTWSVPGPGCAGSVHINVEDTLHYRRTLKQHFTSSLHFTSMYSALGKTHQMSLRLNSGKQPKIRKEKKTPSQNKQTNIFYQNTIAFRIIIQVNFEFCLGFYARKDHIW